MTTLNTQKEEAQMLIQNANGGSYTINTKGYEITGRGVKAQYDNGCYEVTEAKLNQLKSELTWMPNF